MRVLRRYRTLAVVFVALFLGAPSVAIAQDPATGLASAEAQATEARAEISAAEQVVSAAETELAPVADRAAEANEQAEAALARVDRLEEQMIKRRVDAARQVAAINADYQDEIAEHDDHNDALIGAGIGLLLLALIALAWDQFRGLPVVARLADEKLGRLAAILGVLLLLALIIGGVLLGGNGAARVIGATVLSFGIGLLVALLTARHSLLRERGQAQAILSRERLPRKAALVLAALLALLFVGSLGSAMTSAEPERPTIAPELAQLAEAAQGDPASRPTAAVRRAAVVARPLVAQARQLAQARREAEQAVDDAKDTLNAARGRLAQAERDARRYGRLIAQEAAAAEREAARLAAIAAREARQEAEEAEQQAQTVTPTVPTGGDLDCADVADTNFPVPADDPNGFDADGDGIGCET